MYYKYTQGPDTTYEKHFFKEKQTMLNLKHLYWNKEGCCCAASCSLSPSMRKFLRSCSAPHVSLSKPTDDHWRRLGVFVTACEEASDWEEVEPGIKYSEELGAYTSPLNWTTHAKPNIHLQGQIWQQRSRF